MPICIIEIHCILISWLNFCGHFDWFRSCELWTRWIYKFVMFTRYHNLDIELFNLQICCCYLISYCKPWTTKVISFLVPFQISMIGIWCVYVLVLHQNADFGQQIHLKVYNCYFWGFYLFHLFSVFKWYTERVFFYDEGTQTITKMV